MLNNIRIFAIVERTTNFMFKNMLKSELIVLVSDLENKIHNLENDVDYWKDQVNQYDIELNNLRVSISASMFGYADKINKMSLQQEADFKKSLELIFK